jgi:pyrimidine-specific ribonucleoside hydrolase
MRTWSRAFIAIVAVIAVACQARGEATPGPSAPGPARLLVDTDVAPDDLVALSFLVAAPNVEIAAITVSGTGEVHCPRGTEIVLGLLERLDAPAIPVACGGDEPTALGHTFPEAFRAGADAAGGLLLPDTERTPAGQDAVGLLTSTVEEGGGAVRILTLGPLTNLAEALAATPGLAGEMGRIVVMGGAVDVPGNVAGSPDAPADNTSAEWNIYVDPAALQSVLDAGVAVDLVSLDGTNQVPLTADFAQRVQSEATAPPLTVLADLLRMNAYMSSGGYYLWDVVAALAAAGYEMGSFTDAAIDVDVAEGPASGATRRSEGAPNARFLSDVDASVIEDIIVGVMNAD